jgi:hypothetical protein
MAYFANGTEALMFQEDNCFQCIHLDEDGGCPIWDVHFLYSYSEHNNEIVSDILDRLIPDFKLDKGGAVIPTCNMLVKEGGE